MDSLQSHSVAELIAAETHVFIEASAGSGKTTRLVELIVEIVSTRNVKIDEILCVTFTEKAASELKARVFDRLKMTATPGAKNAVESFSLNRIGTIHNFCLRSLKEDAMGDLTESIESAVINESDLFDEAREWVYRTLWSEFAPDALARFLSELDFGKGGRNRSFDETLKMKAIYAFASNKAQIAPNISDRDQINDAAGFTSFTLSAIITRMQSEATAKNIMTFSRMVTQMAHSVESAAFKTKIRNQYKYALIDEFQDTDPVQWEIFHTLFLDAAAKVTLIVVGDPKQAIYKFRGADIFVYLEAKKIMAERGATIDILPYNHRSAPEILKTLDSIFEGDEPANVWQRAGIAYSAPRYGEKVKSTGDAATGAEFFTVDKYNKHGEAWFAEVAAARILAIRRAYPEWTIAVIAYRHKTLMAFAEVLKKRRMDFSYYKQRPDFKRLEIEHFKIFLQSFALPASEGFLLAQNTIFLKATGDAEGYYARLATLIEQNRIVTFLQVLAQRPEPLHLLLTFDRDATLYHSWRIFFRLLLSLCGKKIFDLESLRQSVHTLSSGDDETDDSHGDMLRSTGAVTLITVQSAKGLDWNAVVIADGIHDKRWKSFPFFHNAAGQSVIACDEEAFDAAEDKLLSIEDESRITQLNLLYVALTRAKHKLIGWISPHFAAVKPGPIAYFLNDWRKRGAETSGATLPDLAAAYENLQEADFAPAESAKVMPAAIDHGNIASRISERTSFTALASAEFTETDFIADILPRGSETGQLLHGFLETYNFTDLKSLSDTANTELKNEIASKVLTTFKHDSASPDKIGERILEILHATATAELPLTGGGKISLGNLAAENLWREMPFWSAASIHKVLSNTGQPTRHKTMHGFMDLVFTVDERDYYILDYKSNSLAELNPETIDAYTREHYALQAEIYAEALTAWFEKNYTPGTKRIAGCYFLFLRYLKSGENTGVHFMDMGSKHA